MDNKEIIRKDYIYNNCEIKKVEDSDERECSGIITNSEMDLSRDVVLPEGVNYKNFLGPVFLNHDPSKQIGFSPRLRRSANGIVAKILIAEEGIDKEIDKLWYFVKKGWCKGLSIGFIPMETRLPTKQDFKNFGKDIMRVISKCRLVEFSITPIPDNQSAIITSCKSMNLDPKYFLGEDYKEEIVEEKTIEETVDKKIEELDINRVVVNMVKEEMNREKIEKELEIELKNIIKEEFIKSELLKNGIIYF